MTGYFERFPRITYDGVEMVDITRRLAVRASIQADPRAFHPYEVPAGQRADQIADGYYGASEREWMVFLSTESLDPYYDWYLSDQDFTDFLIKKYGSVEESLERIHHWQVNWYGTDVDLSVQSYGTLDDSVKPYYEPVFGEGGAIQSYSRRTDDVLATTNMIVTVGVGANHSFTDGERVVVNLTEGGTQEGQAELTWSNSTHLRLVHVQTSANVGLYVAGVDSGEERVITSRSYTANVIAVDERPFWEPVTAYAWESDRNEQSRTLRLIDARHSVRLETEISDYLGGV